jgi:hypothetical protein
LGLILLFLEAVMKEGIDAEAKGVDGKIYSF